MNDYEIVNNYHAYYFGEGECSINTNAKQLEATSGKVYLTLRELKSLIALIERNDEKHEGTAFDTFGAM